MAKAVRDNRKTLYGGPLASDRQFCRTLGRHEDPVAENKCGGFARSKHCDPFRSGSCAMNKFTRPRELGDQS